MLDDPFKKRTFTVLESLGWFWRIFLRLPSMLAVYVWPRKPAPDFRERIMLAVTEANDCRYCRYIHKGWAEAAGANPGKAGAESAAEEAAFAFGREVAETGSLDGAIETRPLLEKHYSAGEIRRIEAIVAAIMVGNLSGNTLDAFLERLRGGRPFSLWLALNEAIISVAAAVGFVPIALGVGCLKLTRRVLRKGFGGVQ